MDAVSFAETASSITLLAGGGGGGAAYHAYPPLTEQAYSASDEKDTKNLTIKLSARSRVPSKPPSLLEGDSVTGTVVLSLSKPSKIKSVSVEVRVLSTPMRE